MIKRLSIIFLALLLIVGVAIGGQLKPFPFAFFGKWQPSEDPLLIDDNGFQDIQNLRKDGKRLKGVSGHSKINTTSIDNGGDIYIYPKNGYHFSKDQPSESHVIIYATRSDGTLPRLYQNTTAIPSAGNFSTTILHTDATGAGIGRFSKAPQGNMIYTNGLESMIWGGDEFLPVSFITSTAAISSTATNPHDYSEAINNSLTTGSNIAIIGGGNDDHSVLLMHFDGADEAIVMPDSSLGGAHGNATIVNDAQYDTAQTKFGTSSILFAGSSDAITFADSGDWTLGTVDFTIEAWVRFATVADGTYQTIATQHVDDDNEWVVYWYRSGATKKLVFYYQTGGGAVEIDMSVDWDPSADTWYHVALIRGWGGVAGRCAFTVDGTLQGSYAAHADDMANFADSLSIGVRYSTAIGDKYFNGWMDELRIDKALAAWTSNFTPPTRAYNSSGKTWLVGSYRPLQGVKYYVQDANGEASTMTVKEWQGATWETLTVTDNTDTGASLATTGTVTWTKTGLAKVKYIEGLSLYWYQFSIDAGNASIYRCTADAPFGDIRNIWDGSVVVVASFKKWNDSTFIDYTDYVNTDVVTDVADIDTLDTTQYLLLGFTEPQQGFNIFFVPGETNAIATVMSAYYWDGAAWVAVAGLTDGTDVSGTSLYKSGTISFQPVATGNEFPKAISDEIPLYYYKLQFTVQLGASVDIYYVTGIPNPEPVGKYKFSAFFQNRSFLFNENNGRKNKCIYSTYNAPDIWNGDDSGTLYFGDDTALTAAAVIYNVFQTTGYEQLLVTKANETYRVVGDGPDNWITTKMSGNVGCVAPLSMVVAEVADISQDTKRHVAIWQTSNGVFMCDGSAIIPISQDIANYWDANSSDYIPASRQDDSVGWYDPDLQSYKLLVSSGSGQATHNVELEYSLKYQEWTKIYRENGSGANPLQAGFQVRDTTGNTYSYGATNEGTIYYTENSLTWAGTDIAQYVWTKDLMLDDQIPLMKDTVIDYFRLLLEKKTNTSGEDISVEHYCDRTITTDGTDYQDVPADIDPDSSTIATEDTNLGPCLIHSFKLSADVNSMVDGMELMGMGLYYDTQDDISGVND